MVWRTSNLRKPKDGLCIPLRFGNNILVVKSKLKSGEFEMIGSEQIWVFVE